MITLETENELAELEARAEAAERECERLREALTYIDSLDPEAGAAYMSKAALHGIVLAMGHHARRGLWPTGRVKVK